MQDSNHYIKLATKQLCRLRLILRRFHQSNRPACKGFRIVLQSTRRGNLDRVHTRGRLDPKSAAVDKTSKLKPIPVPPRPLLTGVIQPPRPYGLRANLWTTRMGNVNVNVLSLRIQKHPINLPSIP